jgi:protein ImuA
LTLFSKRTKTEHMGQLDLQSMRGAGALSLAQNVLALGERVVLRKGRIHEVIGSGADIFAAIAAAEQGQSILWIGLYRDIASLCPTGLQAYLNVPDLILVEAVSRGELLWAADQALRSPGGDCVILEMPDTLSLKESRRLQLAAEEGGGLGLILLRGGVNTSAAQTRWECAPVRANQPAWDWACLKGKNGEAGAWRVTCQEDFQGEQNAKDTLHMAPISSP